MQMTWTAPGMTEVTLLSQIQIPKGWSIDRRVVSKVCEYYNVEDFGTRDRVFLLSRQDGTADRRDFKERRTHLCPQQARRAIEPHR